MKKRIHLFDFDGTITSADTLIAFIRFAAGSWSLFTGLLIHSPLLVMMKLGLYSNQKAKQRLFAWYFRGMNIDFFNAICRQFALESQSLLRPGATSLLRRLLDGGETVAIVSASIDNWVKPFFDFIGGNDNGARPKVLGTRIEVDSCGNITGRFTTPNCYGQEKVRRIREAFPELDVRRDGFTVTAYGDSRGDREMLAMADEPHYKPFRESTGDRKQKLGEIVRFGIVGTAATLLQYAIYWSLINWLQPTVAMTIGYAVSFAFNFIASTRYTFHVKASARRGAGFALSHAVNYVLQMLTLNLFLWLGVAKQWAPVPMFCVCVPVNFVLVRFFLKR